MNLQQAAVDTQKESEKIDLFSEKQVLQFYHQLSSYGEKVTFVKTYHQQVLEQLAKLKVDKANYVADNFKNGFHKNCRQEILEMKQIVLKLKTCLAVDQKKEKNQCPSEERAEPICLTEQQKNYLKILRQAKELNHATVSDLMPVYQYALRNPSNQFDLAFFESLHKLLIEKCQLEKRDPVKTLVVLEDWVNDALKEQTDQKWTQLEMNLQKQLNELRMFYTKDSVDYNPSYQIVHYLLSDASYYPYLYAMLTKVPGLVNLKSQEGKSLLVDVTESYIHNYILKLQNQKKTYIDPDYLKEIYFLIWENQSLVIEPKEEQQVIQLLARFQARILRKKYKKEPIENILNQIEQMKKKVRAEKQVQFLPTERVNESLMQNSFYSCMGKPDLTAEYTFVLGDHQSHNNYAYSISLNDQNQFILKVHVADLTSLIERDSALYQMLYEQFCVTKDPRLNLSEHIVDQYFSLIPGKERAVLTYELQINEEGKIEPFRIYQSKIAVDHCYSYKDISIKQKEDLSLQQLIEAYQRISRRKQTNQDHLGFAIEHQIQKVVNLMVGKSLEKQKLPFIYRVQKPLDPNQQYRLQTKLAPYFFYVKEVEFKAIHQVISSDMNYAYYTKKNIGHAGLNYQYYTDLLNPIDSFIGITLQHALIDYYVYHKHDAKTIEEWNRVFDDLIGACQYKAFEKRKQR